MMFHPPFTIVYMCRVGVTFLSVNVPFAHPRNFGVMTINFTFNQ